MHRLPERKVAMCNTEYERIVHCFDELDNSDKDVYTLTELTNMGFIGTEDFCNICILKAYIEHLASEALNNGDSNALEFDNPRDRRNHILLWQRENFMQRIRNLDER